MPETADIPARKSPVVTEVHSLSSVKRYRIFVHLNSLLQRPNLVSSTSQVTACDYLAA